MKKIMIDQNIPHLASWLAHAFAVTPFSPDNIGKEDLAQAEALIVRTLTRIDADFLAQAPQLQCIASATSGIDHVDVEAVKNHNISFAHAPGCNAKAVGDYVEACFKTLGSLKKFGRIGVIGHGHVGQEVAKRFEAQGYRVIAYDPPKAESGSSFQSCKLEDLTEIDALCIHPSLTTTGKFPSLHMINDQLLSQLSNDTIVINASRGAVADEEALLKHADRLKLCLDVWQQEPDINLALLGKTHIATPHIAGYSLKAKWQASKQVTEALCQHFNLTVPEIGAPDLSQTIPLDVVTLDKTWRLAEDKSACFKALRQQQTQRQ